MSSSAHNAACQRMEQLVVHESRWTFHGSFKESRLVHPFPPPPAPSHPLPHPSQTPVSMHLKVLFVAQCIGGVMQ